MAEPDRTNQTILGDFARFASVVVIIQWEEFMIVKNDEAIHMKRERQVSGNRKQSCNNELRGTEA